MSRTRRFFTLVFPSMLAGGVLFGSAFTHADSGRGYGNYYPSSDATVVAQADPRPMPRPMAPPAPPAPYAPYATPATPPTPPTPPPPRHGHSHGGGINVQMHDGKIQIDGVNDLVERSIKEAQDAIRTSSLPAEVRDKLQKRLDKVRTKVEERLSHLDASDLDQLGEELGKMGDDIGKEMDDFGKEMDKYGDKMSKDAMKNFGKNWGKKGHWSFNGNSNHNDSDDNDDSDSDDDVASVPDVDDQDDMDDAVRSLGDLSLKGPQRDQIQRLRADSDRQVAQAKAQLDRASEELQRQLDNISASDAEISRAVDAVSQQEATIRKARILAWHGARRVLDDAQRNKVEAAAKAHKGH
jgi:hypothetical protein